MRSPVPSVAAVAVAALAATALSGTSSPFVAEPERTQLFIDDESMMDDVDCLQLTPSEVQLAAPLGQGEDVNLHVRLVMDLFSDPAFVEADATVDDPATAVDERQEAVDAYGRELVEEHLAVGAAGYADIDVTLDYASFDVLDVQGLDDAGRSEQLEGSMAIQLGKDQYGGERPADSDVVYVLSDRDLTSGGSSGLAGLADCIGGVASPQHAFATGEFDPDAEFTISGIERFYADYTAKVAAHEVGHLMGAHHHYQACGSYGIQAFLDDASAGACTLMTNFVDFVTLPLSPTNQIVVRGHAEAFADR